MQACGAPTQSCCQLSEFTPPSCDIGAICADEVCMACGDAGQPCCASSLTGFSSILCPGGEQDAASLRCNDGTGAGICEQCGREGQICCLDNDYAEPECDAGFNCGGAGAGGLGECGRCGGIGQECCATVINIGELRDPCSKGGACSGGVCVECGGLEQPCCPDVNEDLLMMCGRAGVARYAVHWNCAVHVLFTGHMHAPGTPPPSPHVENQCSIWGGSLYSNVDQVRFGTYTLKHDEHLEVLL